MNNTKGNKIHKNTLSLFNMALQSFIPMIVTADIIVTCLFLGYIFKFIKCKTHNILLLLIMFEPEYNFFCNIHIVKIRFNVVVEKRLVWMSNNLFW